MRFEAQYLQDLIDSARQIAVLIDGFDFEMFRDDRRTRSAVLHELTVIGESANRLTSEMKHRYPEIPWDEIIGTRNVIVHGYFDLLWDRIWNTSTVDVPVLERRATVMLKEQFPELNP